MRPFIRSHFNKLPLTRIKLKIAGLIYRVLIVFLKSPHVSVERRGISYQLDLREGIDLSIYLFGHFQQHILNRKLVSLEANKTILDVGANIGSMSLAFSKVFPTCHIIAIEPTNKAYDKLLCNISLNPKFETRITPVKAYISDVSGQPPPGEIYSSWKIDINNSDRHIIHGGLRQSTSLQTTLSIDDLCHSLNITDIGLIKIDTDGIEYNVLQGAKKTILTWNPYIIFEVGQYIMDEYKLCFDDYLDLFKTHNYTLICIQNKQVITRNNFNTIIPELSTIDILAMPGKEY